MKYLGWLQLILGIWILVSPWVIGFDGISTAFWSNVVAGLFVAVISLWNIFGKQQSAS